MDEKEEKEIVNKFQRTFNYADVHNVVVDNENVIRFNISHLTYGMINELSMENYIISGIYPSRDKKELNVFVKVD